jgi:hypothetical protein
MEKRINKLRILTVLVIYLTVINYSFAFNYMTYNSTQKIEDLLNYNKVEINNPSYLEDLEIYRKTKESTILTTCMLQVRNNLYYNNPQLKEIIKTTKFSKDKIFDKFVIELYNSCKEELVKKSDISQYLQPEKAVNADELLEKVQINPVKFNTEPTFSDSEKELLSIFYKGSLKKQTSALNDVHTEKVEFSASIPELNQGILDSFLFPNVNIIKYLVIGLSSGILSALIFYFLVIYIISKVKKGLVEVVQSNKDSKKRKNK